MPLHKYFGNGGTLKPKNLILKMVIRYLLSTLESGINVPTGINVPLGKFGQNNKHTHWNKRTPWKFDMIMN